MHTYHPDAPFYPPFPTGLLTLLGLLLAPSIPGGTALAGNWPGWRGDGSGVSDEKGLPVYWSAEDSIVWKTALPGEGKSSPIIWENAVFLTASKEDGTKRLVIRVDASNGTILWQKELSVETVARTYPKTGYAAPTPVTDGERVYAFFDSPGLVAVDLEGNVVWNLPLGTFKNQYNMASSPVLCGENVILSCDHSGEGFMVAVDRATGKERWRTPRKLGQQYGTPIVIKHQEKQQIVMAGRTIVSYDPASGKELWRCRGMKPVVSPSPVCHDGLVYVASGRNGPAVAIDPGGRGDVTETHVRLHVPTGGPYVPSPLFYGGHFLLPGDNGMLRFVDPTGSVVIEQRLRGHYTSSPVIADGKLYWTNEKGETYVVDLAKATAEVRKPAIKVLAINRLGEQVLASPAIANGRLFIRTEKHLFCIAGTGKKAKPSLTKVPSGNFAELKKLYESHPAPQGPEVAVRIEVVEALAEAKDKAAIPFLEHVARKDPHWDVSEAAVKVLGAYGEDAVPALLTMFSEWRPYLKIVAARHLGRLESIDALPTLLKGAQDRDSIVRLACLEAIGQIAKAKDVDATKVIPALVSGLDDREGVVNGAAADALALVADKVGPERDRIVQKLLDLTAHPNAMVAGRAAAALREAFKVSEETLMEDRTLYGEQRKTPVSEILSAGPIRVKFQDGELRYLYVGEREIVRRIYFAVRDSRWDTVMPEFDDIKVRRQEQGFTVKMKARCTNDVADYQWTGEIVGTPDGKIRFSVNGQTRMAFRTPRIGINVLYGTDSLAGQAFEAVGADGKATPGEFPKLVSPTLISGKFQTLRFTTPEGVQVSAGLTEGEFGMEDQRNFCDSSYKAFSGVAYKYPNVGEGEKGGQTFVLEVKGAATAPAGEELVRVTIGKPVEGAKMPKLVPREDSKPVGGFGSVNRQGAKLQDSEAISWAFNPAAHMPDDDTFMENLSAVADQVRTVRSFAPRASIRIDPVSIDSPYPRPARDARNAGLFGAAWLADAVRYLALAGVEEVAFTVGPGPADVVRAEMSTHAGAKVLSTQVTAVRPWPVDVLAVEHEGQRVLWLINKTDGPQNVALQGVFDGDVPVLARRLNAQTASQSELPEQKLMTEDGALAVKLSAFEVCQLRVGGQ